MTLHETETAIQAVLDRLAPSRPLPHAPVPRPSRPQPRTPQPRWSRRHSDRIVGETILIT